MSPDEKRGPPVSVDFGRFTGLGIQFVAALALFGVVGWWLDGRLGTTPWLLILGLLLGAALAFYSLLRAVPASRGSKKPPSADA